MFKKIAQALFPASDKQDALAERRMQIATCVVLLEAAGADDEFSDAERDHILEVMQGRFNLDEEEAHELLEESRAHRGASSDLWRYTNEINQAFSHEEKRRVMEEVWRLFYSDGTLSAHEDGLAHKLRHLLNLNHPQMIEAKLKVLKERRG